MPALRWLAILAIGAAAGIPVLTGAHAQVKEAAAPAATRATRTPAPADAYVYIGWPNDGEVLHTRRFKVWFGTRNFGVAPAGVTKPNTGHHHLLIDTGLEVEVSDAAPEVADIQLGLGDRRDADRLVVSAREDLGRAEVRLHRRAVERVAIGFGAAVGPHQRGATEQM